MPQRFLSAGSWDECLFGKTVYPPRGRHGPRIQKDYQLLVIVSGSLRVKVDDAWFDVGPGRSILLLPKRREYFRFDDETDTIHTWVQVTPGCLSASDRKSLQVCVAPHASPSAQMLVEEGLLWRGGEDATSRAALLALGRACLLRFADDVRHADSGAASTVHPALARSIEIAGAHYAELTNAGDLAKRAGISVSRLRSLCRAAGQESPSDLIWRLKSERAVRMIRSTGLTLAEIAEACGYANAFHLSRAVKRHMGLSPKQLRGADRR